MLSNAPPISQILNFFARSRISDSGTCHLEHPAGQLFIVKRRDGDVITRRLPDAAALSANLRLRGAMFSHHMPWGYNALFQGFGQDVAAVDLAVLPVPGDGDQQEATAATATTLYPDLASI